MHFSWEHPVPSVYQEYLYYLMHAASANFFPDCVFLEVEYHIKHHPKQRRNIVCIGERSWLLNFKWIQVSLYGRKPLVLYN